MGDEPVAPDGEPEERAEGGDASAAGPRNPAGVQKYGHSDVRDALERASARHTAVHVAAGAVAKALLAQIGISVSGEALPEAGADAAAVDSARKDRDTLGGVVEVRARNVPPGFGSYARKEDRLDARFAAALMGIQAVKSVEIGDGRALAQLRGSEAHDEIYRDERPLPRDESWRTRGRHVEHRNREVRAAKHFRLSPLASSTC
jgi:chorismate synthase